MGIVEEELGILGGADGAESAMIGFVFLILPEGENMPLLFP